MSMVYLIGESEGQAAGCLVCNTSDWCFGPLITGDDHEDVYQMLELMTLRRELRGIEWTDEKLIDEKGRALVEREAFDALQKPLLAYDREPFENYVQSRRCGATAPECLAACSAKIGLHDYAECRAAGHEHAAIMAMPLGEHVTVYEAMEYENA